jgi:hypothetical protein
VTDMKKFNADYFKDWDYKKHTRFCTALYLALYAFDMTFSYFIIKKVSEKAYK